MEKVEIFGNFLQIRFENGNYYELDTEAKKATKYAKNFMTGIVKSYPLNYEDMKRHVFEQYPKYAKLF